MSELLPDTWHSRELPVLRSIVRTVDSLQPRERAALTAGDIALRVNDAAGEGVHFNNDEVTRAVKALSRGGYIVRADAERLGGGVIRVVDITEKAYRATGAWPSREAMADKLLAALEDLAEYSDDPIEKSRAKKAAEALGGFSRDTLIAVIGASAGVAMQ